MSLKSTAANIESVGRFGAGHPLSDLLKHFPLGSGQPQTIRAVSVEPFPNPGLVAVSSSALLNTCVLYRIAHTTTSPLQTLWKHLIDDILAVDCNGKPFAGGTS